MPISNCFRAGLQSQLLKPFLWNKQPPFGGRNWFPNSTNGFRSVGTEPTVPNFLLEKLTGRSLIRVQGPQSLEFLQGLITNDMNHLSGNSGNSSLIQTESESKSMFTMFLNKAGRVLYDAIIYKPKPNEDTYLVECDVRIDKELQTHLKVFRVRKKINIDIVNTELAVWVAFNPEALTHSQMAATLDNQTLSGDVLVSTDPRLSYLGSRIIAPIQSNVTDLISDIHFVDSLDAHQLHRYRLGIGEGIDELPVAKCFPLESNCDYLHGVSFHKGCYLGQEFTARTHHTGVVRKRLVPVHFNNGRLSAKSSRHVETTHGVVLGKVRGFQQDVGLALLKFEAALQEETDLLFGNVNDEQITGRAIRPNWWPQEAPKK